MNSCYIILVFIGMIFFAVFIFLNYPESWRKNKNLRLILGMIHFLGTVALGLIFTSYKDIPYEWAKWLVSRGGTIYYVTGIMLSIFFGIRLAICKIYQLIRGRNSTDTEAGRWSKLKDKRVHSIVFMVISYAMAITGFINIGQLHTTTYVVNIDKPSAIPSLNITLIADIHAGAGTWSSSYDELSEQILATNPDILLIGGDVFDETTSEQDIRYVQAVIEQVNPTYGSYFIYGNHDDYTENWAAEIMREWGVTVLEDEVVTIAEDIQLIGRLDPVCGAADMEKLIEGYGVDTGKPVVVLQHRPIEFQKLSQLGCDLVMAGHTHGFNIPQFVAVGFWSDMYYGIKAYDDMTAIVTSGVSAWGFHYKWPAKSEVVNIHVNFEE